MGTAEAGPEATEAGLREEGDSFLDEVADAESNAENQEGEDEDSLLDDLAADAGVTASGEGGQLLVDEDSVLDDLMDDGGASEASSSDSAGVEFVGETAAATSSSARPREGPAAEGRGERQEAATEDDQQAWRAFTPAIVDAARCLARVWGSGSGGQCRAKPKSGEVFCAMHLLGDKWKVHGRVDGPIPESKLEEFLRFRRAQEGPQKRKRPDGSAEESLEELVRTRLGVLTREELSAAGPAALAEAIQAKEWHGEEWRALCDDLHADRIGVEKAVEKILLQQEEDVRAGVAEEEQRLKEQQERRVQREAAQKARSAAQKLRAEEQAKGRQRREDSKEAAKLKAAEAKRIKQQERAQLRAGKEKRQPRAERVQTGLICSKNHGLQESIAYAKDGRLGTCDRCHRQIHVGEAILICSRCSWWCCNRLECRKACNAAPRGGVSASPPAGANPGGQKRAAPAAQRPKCTCGLPIHSERCKLFRPSFQSAATFAGQGRAFPQRSRPPSGGAKAQGAGGVAEPPPRVLSEWARKEVTSIEREVLSMPTSIRRDIWRKQLLIYHPDKRRNSEARDARFAGASDEQVNEVFREVKRRYDRAAAEE